MLYHVYELTHAAVAPAHYVQPDAGHYGIFNGSRWKRDIQPRIRDFIRAHRGAASSQ